MPQSASIRVHSRLYCLSPCSPWSSLSFIFAPFAFSARVSFSFGNRQILDFLPFTSPLTLDPYPLKFDLGLLTSP